MIERTVDNERNIVCKALCINQILSIGYDCAMANHHALRHACSACGKKHISNLVRKILGSYNPRYLFKTHLGNVFLNRHSNASGFVNGKISHYEIGVLRDAVLQKFDAHV